MTEKYKILSNYIKDMSSETPDVESFLFTKDNINKYELDIDISSKPLKNKLIEVNTSLKFQNKSKPDKKSYFEVVYASIIRINKNKKNETLFLNHLQKIIDNKTTNADHMNNKFSKNEELSELYDK